MLYEPTIYRGSAAYYAHGRPPTPMIFPPPSRPRRTSTARAGSSMSAAARTS